jgi:prepilin-type processing-associated H-X9-DG protein
MTRVEALVIMGTVALLAVAVLPALGTSGARAGRISCLNNLRQIGRACQIWASDHDGENSWRVPVGNGGTLGNPLVASAWFQYSVISNQLVTPRILVCPSDVARLQRAADNWGIGASGGFLNTSYRNNSVSYPVWLHTSAVLPQAVLSGDRNLQFSTTWSCGLVGINDTYAVRKGDANVRWTNAPYGVHGSAGNLLFNDGHVLQSTSTDLRNALNAPNVEGELNDFHVLAP